MVEGETQPVQSKSEDFSKLEQPNTWGDLRMLIGIFGLYSQFLNLYEMDIIPWRYTLSNQPQLGTLSQKGEMELMKNLWTPYDQSLLERIYKYIVSGPTLAIPEPY